MIKGIGIVKSTANKSSCNSFGDSKSMCRRICDLLATKILALYNF